MSLMDHRILQDDQHMETDEHGAIRHQWIRVVERWETLGGNGKPYCSEGSRDDAIFKHLQSNGFLSEQVAEIAKLGREGGVIGEPLCGVRKVVRYETSSTWEVMSDFEDLDEMTEQLALPPCPHPQDRVKDSSTRTGSYAYCGRCHQRMPSQ